MIAFPVHNGRHRHEREIAQGNLERARRQAQLAGRAAQRFQTRAVRGRVTQLPNAREADLAAEVPADHPQAGRAAVHFIDLLDVLDLLYFSGPLLK